MPERTSYAEGTPSWVDLSTPDPAGAQSFYGGLFGWDFDLNESPDGQSDYVMATKGGKAAAGMMQQPPEQAEMGLPPMWNTYLTVDDINATVEKVEAAGGSVMMPPMQVMDAGHMAVATDPTGAFICFWQPGEHIGCEVVNEAGTLMWNELVDDNIGAAAAFYKAVVGVDSTQEDMGEGDPYTIFMVGEDMVGGAFPPPMEGVPNHWAVYFAVDDCDASAAKVEALGGSIMAPPMDTPPGRISAVADPTGAMFWLMQPADPTSIS